MHPLKIRNRAAALAMALLCGLLGPAPGVRAANFVWDVTPGTAGAQDGAGTWTATGGNWFDETNNLQNQTWANGAGNTAVFGAGGTPGTVAITGTVNTNGLIFRATALNPAYTLSGGTIALADGSAITLFDNASSVAANGRVFFNSTLTGNNITIQKGAGATALALVTLNSASTLSGTLTLASADTGGLFLQVNNAGAFPAATLTGGVTIGTNVSVVIGAGGTWAVPFTVTGTGAGSRGAIRLDVSVTLSGAITLAGNSLITQNTSSTLSTLSGNIGESVAGSVLTLGTQGGTGTIALAGNNTFTGGLVIDVTNVRLDNAGALNATAPNRVTFANTALAKNLSLNGTSVTIASLASSTISPGAGTGVVRNQSATVATLTLGSAADTATFGGTLTDGTGGGALAVVKTGASTQTLAGTNSFTGGLTMNQGTLTLSGTNSFAGGVVMNLGVLNLSGTSTYTGGLALNGGTLNLNSATALGAASSTLTINGGTVGNTSGAAVAIGNGNAIVVNADFAATVSANAPLDLGTGAVSLGTAAGTARVITVGPGTLALGGSIADGTTATGLTKAGAGTLTLGGANSHTGLTLVTAGNLRVRSNGALGSTAAGTQVDANARLQLENNVTITGEALSTPYLENVSGSNVWNGSLRAALLATLTLDAASGSLLITGDVNAASTDNTAHTFNLTGSGTGEIRGVVSNTLTVNKSGSGTWVFAGANTYTNVTNVNAGSLQVGKAGSGQTGSGAVTVGGNATLLGTGIVRGSSFTLNANANLHAGDGVTPADHGTLTFTPVSSANHTLASGSRTFLDLTTATVRDGSFGGFDIGTAGYNAWVDAAAGSGTGGHDRLVFNGTSGTLTVAGNIAVLSSGYTPGAGDVFNLLDWAAVLTADFTSFNTGTNLRTGAEDNGLQFDLPDISASGLFWDVSRFTSSGNIVVVPEPGRAALLLVALGGVVARRRRPRSGTCQVPVWTRDATRTPRP